MDLFWHGLNIPKQHHGTEALRTSLPGDEKPVISIKGSFKVGGILWLNNEPF
jgi:hypothetical protein